MDTRNEQNKILLFPERLDAANSPKYLEQYMKIVDADDEKKQFFQETIKWTCRGFLNKEKKKE